MDFSSLLQQCYPDILITDLNVEYYQSVLPTNSSSSTTPSCIATTYYMDIIIKFSSSKLMEDVYKYLHQYEFFKMSIQHLSCDYSFHDIDIECTLRVYDISNFTVMIEKELREKVDREFYEEVEKALS